MTYTTSDISAAVGIPEAAIRLLMHRGQFVPENGRAGTGHSQVHTRSDALQAVFILALRDAGVALKRAPMFWRIITAQSDVSNLTVWVQERPDGSDTDLKLAPTNGPQPQDVPDTADRIDVGDLQRQVSWNLDQIDARRTATDFARFPHRMPFLSPKPDAPWSVFLANEPGELDANAVARIQDAIEAKSHILAAGATRDALLSLVATIDRMLNAQPVQVPEARESVQ